VDAVDLLFRRLVLAASAADALARPIDVGELLETFVPYRAARRDGQLDTNDDYLHAMMQLVAGEKEYLFVDELMQDDLRNELKSSNPDLSLLRLYLNTKVRISTTAAQYVMSGNTEIDLRPPTPGGTPAVAMAAAPATPMERTSTNEPAPAKGPAPAKETAPTAVAEEAPSAATKSAASRRSSGTIPTTPVASTAKSTPPLPMAPLDAPPVVSASPATASCSYCAQPLPGDRAVRYCPGCGFDLHVRRCAGCSAEIEAEWKFCVTCGRSAA
jgi:hypothetical protein